MFLRKLAILSLLPSLSSCLSDDWSGNLTAWDHRRNHQKSLSNLTLAKSQHVAGDHLNERRRSILSWGSPPSSSQRKRGKQHPETVVDKISGSNPFVLLFTSGTGSAWLWQKLAVMRGVCMIGYEPLADCTSDKSNLERKVGFIRVALSTPGGHSDSEKRARWASWREKLKEKSLPCRVSEVKHSFEGNRCQPLHMLATGFRLRVTPSLGRPQKWPLLKACLWEFGAKIVWVRRRNTLKQALAEYNALLRSAGTTVRRARNQLDGRSGDVHLEHFDGVLSNVAKRNKDAAKLVNALQVPYLEMFYEDMLGDHDDTLAAVEKFLDAGSERLERERGDKPGTYAAVMVPDHLAITKQTPDDLCEAVSNYEAFCRKYSKDKQWRHDLVAPCGQTRKLGKNAALTVHDLGKCCQCEFATSSSSSASSSSSSSSSSPFFRGGISSSSSPFVLTERHKREESSALDAALEEKLASLHSQHKALVAAHNDGLARAEVTPEQQEQRQRTHAVEMARHTGDDDDMAGAAPGRVKQLDLKAALSNSAKQLPAWMELA